MLPAQCQIGLPASLPRSAFLVVIVSLVVNSLSVPGFSVSLVVSLSPGFSWCSLCPWCLPFLSG